MLPFLLAGCSGQEIGELRHWVWDVDKIKIIFRPAATWSPGGVGESGSLQVDVALDGVQLQSGRGVAIDLWLPVNHLEDSLGLQICSIIFNQVGLFRETEMFGNCTKTMVLTWTSITLMSIKAVTEIPIMAPPFKTRTATCSGTVFLIPKSFEAPS